MTGGLFDISCVGITAPVIDDRITALVTERWASTPRCSLGAMRKNRSIKTGLDVRDVETAWPVRDERGWLRLSG